MKHRFNNDGYACRMDYEGNYLRVPIQNDSSLKILDNKARDVILQFCRQENRQDVFRYLIGRAEKRELDHQNQVMKNVNLAARKLPLTHEVLRKWVQDFDAPRLFE